MQIKMLQDAEGTINASGNATKTYKKDEIVECDKPWQETLAKIFVDEGFAEEIKITKPTDVRFNVIANESLILNTGFVDEEFNDVIEDLLMSEKVYVLHNDFTVPVIPKTKSFEVKTRINNKLINHLIEFEMANTVQNLIR